MLKTSSSSKAWFAMASLANSALMRKRYRTKQIDNRHITFVFSISPHLEKCLSTIFLMALVPSFLFLYRVVFNPPMYKVRQSFQKTRTVHIVPLTGVPISTKAVMHVVYPHAVVLQWYAMYVFTFFPGGTIAPSEIQTKVRLSFTSLVANSHPCISYWYASCSAGPGFDPQTNVPLRTSRTTR